MLREQYAKVNPDITDRRTSRRQKRSEKRNLGIDVPEMQTSYLEEVRVSVQVVPSIPY